MTLAIFTYVKRAQKDFFAGKVRENITFALNRIEI